MEADGYGDAFNAITIEDTAILTEIVVLAEVDKLHGYWQTLSLRLNG